MSIAGAALLAAGLFSSSLGPQQAHAGVACRSDPILLVNLALIDVVSTLQTDPAAVRELDYTITIPAGSLLGQTRLTVGLGFPEKVTYVYSPAQPRGTLQIAATVVTQPGVAPFPTTVQASGLLTSSSASGQSNATVTVWLGHQLML